MSAPEATTEGDDLETLQRLVENGLFVTDAAHKQWFLWQVAKQLELRIDGDYDPGTRP
jgi:hypothetical protein